MQSHHNANLPNQFSYVFRQRNNAQYNQEYNLLLTAISDLRTNLPNPEHASYFALDKIADAATHLAFNFDNIHGFDKENIPKIRALTDTLVHAKLVAQDPLNIETNQALVQSAEKMQNEISGTPFFRESSWKPVGAIVGLSGMVAMVALMSICPFHALSCLAIYLLMVKPMMDWAMSPEHPIDKYVSNIKKESIALNQNSFYHRNNAAPAPQAQPQQEPAPAYGLA